MQLSADRVLSFRPEVIAYAVFVPTGIVTVMIGPLLPILAARWSLNDAQSGYLISAQFTGALLGTLLSSLLLPRFGFRWSIAAGQIVMASGTTGLLETSFSAGTAAIFCYGAGIGLTIPAGNLMVAEASPERRFSALNLLNFCWSAGAISCPFLLAYFHATRGIPFFLGGIAMLLLGLTAVVVASSIQVALPLSPKDPDIAGSWFKFLREPAAIVLGALFFIYVGSENGIGAWLASHAGRTGAQALAAWMSVPSFFYGALLWGRALAPLTLKHMTDSQQAISGAVLAMLSSLLLILSQSIVAIWACAFLAGFGLSTLYPIIIALLSGTFAGEGIRVAGFIFALSTLGGAIMPWLVGLVSTRFNALRLGLVIPPAGCLLMVMLFASSRWSNEMPTELRDEESMERMKC
jgi:FHS family glucose/mannose:H+ symporter-like MFS transporter